MKKIFLTAVMALCITGAFAQDNQTSDDAAPAPLEQLLVYENPQLFVQIGEIKYEPKSTGQQVKNGVLGALAANEIPLEMESVVPQVKEALATSVTKALRFRALNGEPSADQLASGNCLKFTATITGCNTTLRMRDKIEDKLINITAYVYLTNVKTGEVVASQCVNGEAWCGLFTTIDDANRYAIQDMYVKAINQYNSWYPLRGHMLDKGFEKGKKQKLKEIYIDLGSGNSMGTGYTCNIYTVRRIAGRVARKYIGRGKVVEILGDDISTVKLSKGADQIKEAFDNGAEIAVSVN